jgi:hypothetical protein
VRLDDVLDDLAGAKGARILLLDACRDNGAIEALRNTTPKDRSAGLSRGLARVPQADGRLVVFATQPDRVAADGSGEHSPFATALLAHISEPAELRTLLTRVRNDVARATNKEQIPEVSDSLLGEIFLQPRSLVSGSAAGVSTSPVAVPDAEVVFWQSIVNSTNRADFEAYLSQYPSGSFASLARTRLAALEPSPSPLPKPSSISDARQQDALTNGEGSSTTAIEAATEFFRNTALPLSDARSYFERIYASEVNYFGQPKAKAGVIAEKVAYMTRWPDRGYNVDPASVSATCDVMGRCQVSGVVQWSASSVGRKTASAGTARFRLVFTTVGPVTLVSEWSEVLTRTASRQS